MREDFMRSFSKIIREFGCPDYFVLEEEKKYISVWAVYKRKDSVNWEEFITLISPEEGREIKEFLAAFTEVKIKKKNNG